MSAIEERTASVLARHKMLSSVQGSGWHPDDLDEQLRRRRGQVPLVERPIAIQDGAMIHMVGVNADIFRNALVLFQADFGGEHPDTTAQGLQATQVFKEVVSSCGEGNIAIDTHRWNAVLFCLQEVGLRVVVASLKAPRGET